MTEGNCSRFTPGGETSLLLGRARGSLFPALPLASSFPWDDVEGGGASVNFGKEGEREKIWRSALRTNAAAKLSDAPYTVYGEEGGRPPQMQFGGGRRAGRS